MPRHTLKTFAFAVVICLALGGLAARGATYQVSSIAELNSRISTAVAGDTIVVSNGVYTNTATITVTRTGTASSPILIRAETVGGVEITGTGGFSLNSPAAYIIIQGFKFTHSGSIGIGTGSSHCRLTRNIIELSIPAGSDVSYVNISGDDAEIDRNELRNKSTLGEMLDVTGSGSLVARRLWVHHNYFHDFTSPGGNGAETIRLGLSGLSLSTGNAVVEYNLFVRCTGENEMISNKSSGNTYRYNTVLDSPGAEISQRHGNDCLYYGNYMRNTQGMRIYGDHHKIFSNYLENNSIGVNMGNGDGDVYNGDPLTSHDRPDDNVVVFNTFIDNSTHYEMGGRTGGLGSSNTVVANNIFQGGGSMASISTTAPYTGTFTSNIRWQTSTAGDMPASGYRTINPLLALDATGAYHLQSGSPAINAGVGAYDYYGVFSSFPYVSVDMDGQPRDATRDIGADEFSAAPVIARILSTNDVGPNSSTNTRPAAKLKWTSSTSAVWDVGGTANWLNLDNSSVDVFLQGDAVLLDDTGGSISNIVVDVSVWPSALTNDSSLRSYTISGNGTLSGGFNLVKKGSSTLTLATTNDFAGTTTILAGTLKAAASGALGSGGQTIINEGTLDVNGINFTGEPVTAAASGAGGQGAIVNTGPQQTSALRNVTLTGDTTLGGTGRWDIRASSSSSTNGCSLSTSGQPYSLTKVGLNQVSLVAVCIDAALADITVKEGVFAIQTVTSQVGNPSRTITVYSNATLELWNLNAAPLNKRLVLSNGASLWNESGNSVIVGPVSLTNGITTFNIAGTSLTISNNAIAGAGGFAKTGAGTLFLRAVNSYSGPTTVNASTLALSGTGAIGASSLITIAAGASLDVTGRADGKLTLNSGQTLTGDGVVNGSLTVGQNATVAPGSQIGGLTISNAVQLFGTTRIKLNRSLGTNDFLQASSIAFGGTLFVTNLNGTILPGDAFKIFYAGTLSGVFDKITPAIPALNLGWDTNTLASDGILRVVTLPTPAPHFTGVDLVGTNLLFSGSDGVPGRNFCVLTSTNLALPFSSWTPTATNQFDDSGKFLISGTMALSAAQLFYLLRISP